MTEGRKAPRYRIEPGSFAYYALGSGAIYNLSLAGVFIEDRKSTFREGAELEVELRLGEELISLRGIVRRSRPGVGFAVQFSEIPPDTKQRLQEYFRTQFGPE
jgi:hypothetical protein